MRIMPLQKLASRYFQSYFALHPVTAANLGIQGYDHLLPSYSDEIRKKEDKLDETTREKLSQIRRESLTPEERFDYDLFAHWLEEEPKGKDGGKKWHNSKENYKTDPERYGSKNAETIFNHLLHPSKSPEEDARNITSLLEQFPRLVEEGKMNLTKDTPQLWVKIEIDTLPSSIEFLRTLPGIYQHATDHDAGLKEKLEKGIETACNSLHEYRTFLQEELLPIARGTFAIGPQMFAWKLKQQFYIDESPARLEAWAKRQIWTTRQKMKKLALEMEPGKTPADILKEMEKEHPPAENLIDTYRFETMRARKFLIDHDILTMPKEDNCEVMQTPRFLAHALPNAAYEFPQPYAKTARGTFLVTIHDMNAAGENLAELLGRHNFYSMRNTIVHEAYPGHHVHLSRAREIKESPLRHLLVNLMNTSIKDEGWGLYSEQLMVESGFLDTKKDEMIRLKWLLHRQIRVLVGIGLHTGKLTRDEAVEMFVRMEPALPRTIAEGEVDYFTKSPLQPLSYALGLRQILNLRKKIRKSLGKKFSLKDFHDALLSTGQLPLGLVTEKIEEELLARHKMRREKQAS